MAQVATYKLGTGLLIKEVEETETHVITRSFVSGYTHMLPEERQTAERTHSIEITALGLGIDGADLPINTLGDLHLIPQERPVIAQPAPVTSYVEVPGYKNREVDMTEALTGSVMFGPREGTLSFYYENLYRHVSDYHLPKLLSRTVTDPETHQESIEYYTVDFHEFTRYDPEYETTREFYYWYKPWNLIYMALANYINGRRVKLKLLDDPEYYYTGRLRVSNFKSGQNSFGTVELTYKLDPYRVKISDGSLIL